MPPTDVASESQAVLVEAHQASTGATHPVSDGLHIGRAAKNDVRVLDPSVSRQHALVAVNSGEFVIQDLHSQNGTFVNGERVRQRGALRRGSHQHRRGGVHLPHEPRAWAGATGVERRRRRRELERLARVVP